MAVCSVDHSLTRSPLCHQCGEINPFNSQTSPFEVFGIKPSYHLDLNKLENRFFELTRILHPDKFATQCSEKLITVTQWYALLTTAFSTLKDPTERASALFRAVGFMPSDKRSQVPADLAEDYFELKELVMEAQDTAPLVIFQQKIDSRLKECDQSVNQAMAQWEKTQSPDELGKAAVALDRRSYLVSMKNDLEKTCQRLSAST
jgi:molecular chaperone HscB